MMEQQKHAYLSDNDRPSQYKHESLVGQDYLFSLSYDLWKISENIGMILLSADD